MDNNYISYNDTLLVIKHLIIKYGTNSGDIHLLHIPIVNNNIQTIELNHV